MSNEKTKPTTITMPMYAKVKKKHHTKSENLKPKTDPKSDLRPKTDPKSAKKKKKKRVPGQRASFHSNMDQQHIIIITILH